MSYVFYTSTEWAKRAKTKKIGRNDLCPCGSNRKFKHCHGKYDSVQYQIKNDLGADMARKKVT